jgi:hypothetical protein
MFFYKHNILNKNNYNKICAGNTQFLKSELYVKLLIYYIYKINKKGAIFREYLKYVYLDPEL